MALKVKVNDHNFQYQLLRVSQDACLVQIWWFQLKFVTSYHADKEKFTDRRTDRWMQATTIPLGPERTGGKKINQTPYHVIGINHWPVDFLTKVQQSYLCYDKPMMMTWHGNAFHITGPSCQYCQICYIRHTKSPNFNVSCLI